MDPNAGPGPVVNSIAPCSSPINRYVASAGAPRSATGRPESVAKALNPALMMTLFERLADTTAAATNNDERKGLGSGSGDNSIAAYPASKKRKDPGCSSVN